MRVSKQITELLGGLRADGTKVFTDLRLRIYKALDLATAQEPDLLLRWGTPSLVVASLVEKPIWTREEADNALRVWMRTPFEERVHTFAGLIGEETYVPVMAKMSHSEAVSWLDEWRERSRRWVVTHKIFAALGIPGPRPTSLRREYERLTRPQSNPIILCCSNGCLLLDRFAKKGKPWAFAVDYESHKFLREAGRAQRILLRTAFEKEGGPSCPDESARESRFPPTRE